MNRTKEAVLLMSSLSIYKGILNRTVAKAYYKLLLAFDKDIFEFCRAWGEFFAVLCNKGCSDDLAKCLTETALFDENAFSRASAQGTERQLPSTVLNAVRRDIYAIRKLSSLSPEVILNEYKHRDELGSVAESLPKWRCGHPVSEFSDENDTMDRLAEFYFKNGCGIFARYKAFIWRERDVQPVIHPDSIRLSSLRGYDTPRNIVVNNTLAFIRGTESNNCLLYGDRGTGKSSTVKAILNEYSKDGLRMVEIPKERLSEFPLLVDKIAPLPLKYVIFIDDLSFSSEDKSYAELKAVLEGSLAARPENTLIYATSNRRHIIKETFSDRDGDDMHRNDTIQEMMSLSDRFGITVNFSKPDKEQYLEIVKSLAREAKIEIGIDELCDKAEKWAIQKGGRSPRVAKQFIRQLSIE